VAADPDFAAIRARLPELADARRFVGRAPQQVDEFLSAEVEPLLAASRAMIAGARAEVRV
jgi:adenylosuccinate lyase